MKIFRGMFKGYAIKRHVKRLLVLVTVGENKKKNVQYVRIVCRTKLTYREYRIAQYENTQKPAGPCHKKK